MGGTKKKKMETVKDIDRYVDTFGPDTDGGFKTGFVIKVIQQKKSPKSAAETITALCRIPVNERALTSKLRRLSTQFKKLRSANLKHDSVKKGLHDLLSSTFVLPTCQQPSSSTTVSVSSVPAAGPSSPHADLLPPSSCSTHPAHHSTPKISGTLRGDCDKCFETRKAGTAALSSIKKKLSVTRAACFSLKRDFNSRAVNLFRKRKTEQLKKKSDRVKEQAKTISILQNELSKVEKKCFEKDEEIKKLKKENKNLRKENAKFHDQKQELKVLERNVRNLEVERDLAVISSDADRSGSPLKIKTQKDNKTYSYLLRKCVYNCLLNQVPVGTVGTILDFTVQTLTGKKLTSIPYATTAAKMTAEMGVLSDLQVAEALTGAASINLAWDATTVDGKHINEVHINTPDQTLTVCTQQLAGGTAKDYSQQILTLISELAGLYADFQKKDVETVESAMKGKVLSTLTDRAAANHATVVLLNQSLNTSLLELYCHLHPLDGMANAARTTLRKMDAAAKKESALYGKDCCVANLLYAISKLRYKATGDPTGFKAFLKLKQKPCSTFIRYVGNRLHVFFHLAGAVYLHRSLLEEYLESHCAAKTLGNKILKDLRDPYLVSQLCAVAWMGKIITAPWMALMYTPMTERNHLQMYERGAATAFVSRNKALKMLQLGLPDFRALCIFKGIYPVEPRHKKKVNKGSTAVKTYYNLKDIQFLSHDILITKFREKKHYVRRLKKAIAKKNRFAESIIRDNKPVYSLKSVMKERYPTFTDALRDLDDCLNLCFVFATFPHSKRTHVEMIQLCKKRTVEFLHYVIAAKALRKVFVSIKGIYYQADIKGETVTWVISHKRGHDHPQEVDYKIMQTFAEYYTVLLGHINIKLYSDAHMVYPPQLANAQQVDKDQCLEEDTLGETLASLAPEVQTTGEAPDDEEEDPEVDAMNAATADDPDFIEKSKLEAEKVKKIQTLFKGLKFFLNREVPREDLTFVIRACNGKASWDYTLGVGATYKESDDGITHQIVDRPAVTNQRLDRTYVQPQWVFDCINARTLLPAQDYFPGVPCPPHLSPFVEEKEGEYVPDSTVKFQARMEEDESDEEEIEDDDNESDEDEEDDAEDGSIDEEEDDTPAITGTKRKRVEREDENVSSKKPKVTSMAVTAGVEERVDKEKLLNQQTAEDRRLGEMMIPKKHRRLYHKIMTSRKKSSQEARKLQEKKEQLEKKKKQDKKQKRRQLAS